MIPNETLWLFVIDTDTYAGGFCRELTAFCTGQICAEDGTGLPEAETLAAASPVMHEHLADLVEYCQDEHGVARPCTLYPTPGWWNDGLGGHYPDALPHDVMPQQVYAQKVAQLTPEGQAHIQEIGTYPAYLSVAIFLRAQPSPDVVAFLIRRAHGYWTIVPEHWTITGFRLLQRVTREALVCRYPADGVMQP